MSGIAGIIQFAGETVDPAEVARMLQAIRHRGPDGSGVDGDERAMLGHVHLCTSYHTRAERQPVCNEDRTLWAVLDGRLDNHQELRRTLTAAGHRFQTDSQAETLVHLYEQYSRGAIERIRGVFAFALWDRRTESLTLVRDRIGVKPAYYHQADNAFFFASEPKALLQCCQVKCALNSVSVADYLTYRAVPAPSTLFEGIARLRPGHALTVTATGVREEQYWDIPLHHRDHGERRIHDEEVESCLLEAVKRQIAGGGSLGAFLSGGLDSSLILALAASATDGPIRTYAAGYREVPSCDVPYAKLVADRYRTQHEELILDAEGFMEHVRRLTWLRDSPLTEPGEIPLYLLARRARQDVRVLLSGEGGDELFGGYPRYVYDRYAPLVSWMPRAPADWLIAHLPSRHRRLEVALRSLSYREPAARWARWLSPFSERETSTLLARYNGWQDAMRRYAGRGAGAGPLDRMLYADCKLWLPDCVLEAVDRVTMGASVECRMPMLDQEFVELAFRLPASAKVRGRTPKWQLKRVARKYLPEEVTNRYKAGIGMPFSQWFRGDLRDTCYDTILEGRGLIRQLLSRRELERILDDHCRSRKDNGLKVWTLLSLAVWDDIFGRAQPRP